MLIKVEIMHLCAAGGASPEACEKRVLWLLSCLMLLHVFG